MVVVLFFCAAAIICIHAACLLRFTIKKVLQWPNQCLQRTWK
jgi:hypothetical protein